MEPIKEEQQKPKVKILEQEKGHPLKNQYSPQFSYKMTNNPLDTEKFLTSHQEEEEGKALSTVKSIQTIESSQKESVQS